MTEEIKAKRTFEESLPFIAGLVAAIITEIALALVVGESIIVVAVGAGFLVVGQTLLKLEPYAFYASFLFGLALAQYQAERYDDALKVAGFLAFGVLWQLGAHFLAHIRGGKERSRNMSIGRNTIFALTGMLIAYYLNYRQCSDTLPVGASGSISILWLELTFCGLTDLFRIASDVLQLGAVSDVTIESYRSETYMVFFRGLLLFPFFWGAFFAALSAVGINIFRPLALIGRTFAALRFRGCLQGIVAIATFFAILVLPFIETGLPEVFIDLIGVVLIGVLMSVAAYNYGSNVYQPSEP